MGIVRHMRQWKAKALYVARWLPPRDVLLDGAFWARALALGVQAIARERELQPLLVEYKEHRETVDRLMGTTDPDESRALRDAVRELETIEAFVSRGPGSEWERLRRMVEGVGR